MPSRTATPSDFGTQLRHWRRARGVSQLELATRAGTTPRHVSFIETGRSRPGRDVILRIAESLRLSVRECNDLLASAGLPRAYAERPLDDASILPILDDLRTLVEGHAPYPAAVIEETGRVRLCNATYERLLPGALERTPEELIDQFYGPPGRAAIENWEEIAWVNAERRRRGAERSGDPRLVELVDRAFAWLEDVPRPAFDPRDEAPLIMPRIRIGADVVSTYSAALRFETAREVTLSELRVELIYPSDAEGARVFRRLAATR
ncbi:MAG: helix-turn-helix domain-containing protein [Myxococcota bacterium]